jgi:hypothetical protein
MKRIVLAPLLAAAACATGPYSEPYAVIAVDKAPSADPLLVPVIVNRVDDQTALDPYYVAVPPGPHRVVVDVPPRKGFRLATQQTFALVTEPCKRYFIAAKLDTPVTQEWKPVIRTVERIAECEARYGAR